jgi:CO/xanthine dehydrogenase Mo-binding subunit
LEGPVRLQDELILHVETPLEDGPWGATGVGEHVMIPTVPCLASALNDALGIRFNDLPLSAEKIFLKLRGDGK